ncbi:MAG: transporter [Smithella sp.]
MKKNIILMASLIIAALMVAPVLAQTPADTQNQQTQNSSTGSVAAPAPAPDKAPSTHAKQQRADDGRSIQQKIDELQKQVEALKEQGRTREKLTITAEEQAEKEKSVLTAVGREYTLMQKGKFELEYSMRYEYTSSSELVAGEENTTLVHPRANHTIRNAIGVQYGLLDNLTINANLPFVYSYDKTGSSSSRDITDVGDITIGLDYQPFKSGGIWPTTIFTLTGIFPTGRSPYKINRNTDLPTGNGTYAVALNMNMSKSVDPAIIFGGVGMTYRFEPDGIDYYINGIVIDAVKPGMSFNAALGLAYSISYALSMNVQFQYVYYNGTDYLVTGGETAYVTPAYSSANLIVGTGWRFSPKWMVSFSVGVGLTKNDPDFFFLARLPFSF